jgi:chaperonin GroES
LGGRVLVKRLEETETTKGGIIIPDSAKEKPKEGRVVALGTGKLDKDGKKIAFNVKVDDRVLFTSYAGTEVTVDDDEYLIMSEEDILGVVG